MINNTGSLVLVYYGRRDSAQFTLVETLHVYSSASYTAAATRVCFLLVYIILCHSISYTHDCKVYYTVV